MADFPCWGGGVAAALKAALTDESIASQPPTREERQHAYTLGIVADYCDFVFVISFTDARLVYHVDYLPDRWGG